MQSRITQEDIDTLAAKQEAELKAAGPDALVERAVANVEALPEHPDYLLGPDPKEKLFNEARVEEAAAAIATDIRAMLEDISQDFALRKTHAFNNGLTNGESRVATIRALALVQIEETKLLADMWHGSAFDHDDE